MSGQPASPSGPWPWPPLVKASAAVHAAALAGLAIPGGWPWALAALVADHALLTATGLWPRSSGLGPNVTRLPPQAGTAGAAWALTIDDGPDPEVTPQVLDLLAELNVKASFFLVAERARAHPALTRTIVAAGHDVQNHSADHRHHFSVYGPKALATDISRAQAILADLTGRLPHCFRAPAGLRSPLLDPVLHRLDLHLVSWTRRGFDTRTTDPARVLRRLVGPGLAAGDILLLHDGHAARHPATGRPVILEVLPGLARAAQQAGLRTVTLAEGLPTRRGAASPRA